MEPVWLWVFVAIIVLAAIVWSVILIVRPSSWSKPMRGDSWDDHHDGRLSEAALTRRRAFGCVTLIGIAIFGLITWNAVS